MVINYDDEFVSRCCEADIVQKYGDKKYYCEECKKECEAMRIFFRPNKI